MSLPARQQAVLDQIEQILQAADPRLKSMFAAFARLAPREAMPTAEALPDRSARRTVLISVIALSVLTAIVISIAATSKSCPPLPPNLANASTTVRLAACSNNMDLWSRGSR